MSLVLVLAAALNTAQIDAIATEEMARLKIAGMQIAIARDGKIVHSGAYGLANVEQRVPVTAETRFRTASMAKSLTATAVMQLVEAGKLDLDAPVSTYCPAFAKPVTARQLLSHTSGVRHYAKRGESRGTDHYFTIQDSLRIFGDDPLLFEPGTKLGYSTYGYSILGCAIEGASKETYDDYMRAHVFTPAGMTHSGPDHHFMLIPQRASWYSVLSEGEWKALPPSVRQLVKPGDLYNAPPHDTSMKRAGGGLLSTAEDLVRFALAFQDGKLVNRSTADAMWTVQKTTDGKDVVSQWGPFGLGWLVRKRGGVTEIYSSGGQTGARGSLYLYPDRGIVLAVMTNVTNAEIIPMEQRILKMLMPDLPESETYRPVSE